MSVMCLKKNCGVYKNCQHSKIHIPKQVGKFLYQTCQTEYDVDCKGICKLLPDNEEKIYVNGVLVFIPANK